LDLHLQDYEKHILSKILNLWREHIFEKLATLCHTDPIFHKCKKKKKKREIEAVKTLFLGVVAVTAVLLEVGTLKSL
jgi:hypothetical protein